MQHLSQLDFWVKLISNTIVIIVLNCPDPLFAKYRVTEKMLVLPHNEFCCKNVLNHMCSNRAQSTVFWIFFQLYRLSRLSPQNSRDGFMDEFPLIYAVIILDRANTSIRGLGTRSTKVSPLSILNFRWEWYESILFHCVQNCYNFRAGSSLLRFRFEVNDRRSQLTSYILVYLWNRPSMLENDCYPFKYLWFKLLIVNSKYAGDKAADLCWPRA